ncbi:hypothetical protein TrLO_g11220 [Triparma laevis f. longispina]|uniref:Myb-like domain-containing protein n=1 Tax=Triparma laevis f. longispina TaxID=1714387 RepID=A0A9W7FJ86_9STRA|nr:hypothetical protein TrLO_g11220 [Triparma laevis f. longispina]
MSLDRLLVLADQVLGAEAAGAVGLAPTATQKRSDINRDVYEEPNLSLLAPGSDHEVVPGTTRARKPAKPRDRSSGKKRKAAKQVKEQPRNVKKFKTAKTTKTAKTANSTKTAKPRWTAEENTALVEGVNEYGLDFDLIKAEAGVVFVRRKARALYDRFVEKFPDRFRELREVNGKKSSANTGTAWTEEEDEALKRGVREHGADWKTIMETEKEVLKGRTAGAAQARYNRHRWND